MAQPPVVIVERRRAMRKIFMAMMAVVVLSSACGSDGDSAGAGQGASEGDARAVGALDVNPGIVADLARARMATAKYATDLERAKADGYTIITQMIPDMGYHFMNPGIQEFDVERPPILVYGRDGDDWQLVAIEWAFPEKPAEPLLDGATYGSFAAACHFEDGTFMFLPSEDACPESSETGAAFGFWHPPLVTMHVWLWYPNPDGLFAGFNPLMGPFNQS